MVRLDTANIPKGEILPINGNRLKGERVKHMRGEATFMAPFHVLTDLHAVKCSTRSLLQLELLFIHYANLQLNKDQGTL